MQFQYNSDYPGLSSAGTTAVSSADPLAFPPAQPIPCARITTRVFHPNRNQVATVQNVLVRTAPLLVNPSSGIDGDDSFSSGMSSTSSSDDDDDDSMKLDDADDDDDAAALPTSTPQVPNAHTSAAAADQPVQNAYWIQRTIREAIYGRVLFAVVLKRRQIVTDGAEWEVTGEHCAVKEMNWQHIRRERDRLAEDPIKEVSAMQYIQKWFEITRKKHNGLAPCGIGVAESFTAMRELNIMMPLDLLTDERNLYSIMPYCDGGELFERLDLNERFSEEEARYWMDQVLNVSVCLCVCV